MNAKQVINELLCLKKRELREVLLRLSDCKENEKFFSQAHVEFQKQVQKDN